MNIAIIGGSGKTGRAVAAALSLRGVRTRAIGRADWPDLDTALAGYDAVHVIAPNMHPDEPQLVSQVLDSARRAKIRRIGYHSVAAPYAPAMPHHLGKAKSEDLVRRCGMAWTIVQPCAYLENFAGQLQAGHLRVPYRLDRLFGLVALVDVAEATAAVLTDTCHVGATYELGGPDMVSVADLARAGGVAASQIPVGEWESGIGASLPVREKEWLAAMFSYYDEHGLPTGGRTLEMLLGRPATSVSDWLAQRSLPA